MSSTSARGVLEPRVRPGPGAAGRDRTTSPTSLRRAHRRRGRARRQQQRRRRVARARGARRRPRGRRLARRARRDRRRLPDSRRPRPLGRADGRGRHDEPDPRGRLRARNRPRDRAAAARPPVELPDRRLHGAPRPRSSRASPRRGLLLVDDLGSGSLADAGDEPTAASSLAAGADLVCFSGDKLLGGPQAGIVVGRAELVERLRRHPLQRALRADKLTLAALEGTLALHADPERAREEIPVLRMLDEPRRARSCAGRATGGARRRRGGGDRRPRRRRGAPARRAPERRVRDRGGLAAPLRLGEPPVLGIVRDGRLLLDAGRSPTEVDEAARAVLRARRPSAWR